MSDPIVTLDENQVPHGEAGTSFGGHLRDIPGEPSTWIWLYKDRAGARIPVKVSITRYEIVGVHYYVRFQPDGDLVWDGTSWRRPWDIGGSDFYALFEPEAVEPEYDPDKGEELGFLSKATAREWLRRTWMERFPSDRFYVHFDYDDSTEKYVLDGWSRP